MGRGAGPGPFAEEGDRMTDMTENITFATEKQKSEINCNSTVVFTGAVNYLTDEDDNHNLHVFP